MSNPIVWLDQHPIWKLIVAGLVILAVGFVFYALGRLLLISINQAGDFDPLTTLMVILGTVTVLALLGALITGTESAYTIAATGVGAFAGTLTARAQNVPPKPPADPFDPDEYKGRVDKS
jgi:hypothetical protein